MNDFNLTTTTEQLTPGVMLPMNDPEAQQVISHSVQAMFYLLQLIGKTYPQIGNTSNMTPMDQTVAPEDQEPSSVKNRGFNYDDFPEYLTKEAVMEITGWTSNTLEVKRSRGEIPYYETIKMYPKKEVFEYLFGKMRLPVELRNKDITEKANAVLANPRGRKRV